MTTFVYVLVVCVLFVTLCRLAYRDYKNDTFSWVAFFVPLGLLIGVCGGIYTMTSSAQLALLRMAHGLCVMLVGPVLRSFLSSDPRFQQLVQDRKTIARHWEHDKDLGPVKTSLFLLQMLSIGLFVLGIFLLNDFLQSFTPEMVFSAMNNPMHAGDFLLMPGPLCVLVAFLVSCLGTTIRLYYTYDIIFHRNHPTMYKIANFCYECTKGGGLSAIKGAALTAGFFELSSGTPMFSPTFLGNMYQTYSPTGRGFGFTDQVTHARHVALELCPSYQPKQLVHSSFLLSSHDQNEFIREHAVEVGQYTTVTQRQQLGIKISFQEGTASQFTITPKRK